MGKDEKKFQRNTEEKEPEQQTSEKEDQSLDLLFKDEMNEQAVVRSLIEFGNQPWEEANSVADYIFLEIEKEIRFFLRTKMYNNKKVLIKNNEGKKIIRKLKQIYPCIEYCGDILSAALMNAGPIIHPPLIILNTGPLEHFSKWDIHNEGTQDSVKKVIFALDNERILLRKKLLLRYL